MSLLKNTFSFLAWLVALLSGVASLSFCAVWGLDNAGITPVWSVPGVGGVLAAVCFRLFLRLKPALQLAAPRPTWRERMSSRVSQMGGKLAQVAPRLRPLWPVFSTRAAASATVTPSGVATSTASVTPVHSIVIPVQLPPRSRVASAVSVAVQTQKKEQTCYVTT